MATYAIGDVQGCFDTLQRLIARIPLDPTSDTLWLVGDLVNRGPKSAEVLRWVKNRGERARVVLGNHDLHLLAAAAGERKRKRRDTLADVLDAPDRDELIDWLRHRPLFHRDGDHAMVHAGIHPSWTLEAAAEHAREVEQVLRSDDWRQLFVNVRPSAAPPWSEELSGWERIAAILSVLVRIRAVHDDGSLCEEFVGPLGQVPAGCRAWFQVPGRRWDEACVVFGHWAALGLHIGDDHIGLDSGCVWGERLTAVRLEDRAVFQHEACD